MPRYELGLGTFGDVTLGSDGQPKPMHQVLRDVVEEGVLADQCGVHFLGLGEHPAPISPSPRPRSFWAVLSQGLWLPVSFVIRFGYQIVAGVFEVIEFKGVPFPKSVILFAVFFYVRYAVSYRDLEDRARARHAFE